MAKPPADLRKETMRISLPPRPGAAGALKPGVPALGVKPSTPAPIGPVAKGGPGVGTKASATLAPKPAAAPVGVRTVVDTDSAGTALAIAALLASLISFGVVLMSFLEK